MKLPIGTGSALVILEKRCTAILPMRLGRTEGPARPATVIDAALAPTK